MGARLKSCPQARSHMAGSRGGPRLCRGADPVPPHTSARPPQRADLRGARLDRLDEIGDGTLDLAPVPDRQMAAVVEDDELGSRDTLRQMLGSGKRVEDIV